MGVEEAFVFYLLADRITEIFWKLAGPPLNLQNVRAVLALLILEASHAQVGSPSICEVRMSELCDRGIQNVHRVSIILTAIGLDL